MCLTAEFTYGHYQGNGQTTQLQSHVLHHNDGPLEDIVDEASADGVLNSVRSLIRNLKSQQHCIHLSMTGGRRFIASIAVEAALLNFTHAHHIWHIYTPEAVQKEASEGKLMHSAPHHGVRLIERHFVPLSTYFADLPQSTAQETMYFQKKKMDALERTCCEQVVKQVSLRQVDVLRAFAQGLNIQETAEYLSISIRTVGAHKTKLLDMCREVWAIEQSTSRLGYHFLYKTFAPYFDNSW